MNLTKSQTLLPILLTFGYISCRIRQFHDFNCDLNNNDQYKQFMQGNTGCMRKVSFFMQMKHRDVVAYKEKYRCT